MIVEFSVSIAQDMIIMERKSGFYTYIIIVTLRTSSTLDKRVHRELIGDRQSINAEHVAK